MMSLEANFPVPSNSRDENRYLPISSIVVRPLTSISINSFQETRRGTLRIARQRDASRNRNPHAPGVQDIAYIHIVNTADGENWRN